MSESVIWQGYKKETKRIFKEILALFIWFYYEGDLYAHPCSELNEPAQIYK